MPSFYGQATSEIFICSYGLCIKTPSVLVGTACCYICRAQKTFTDWRKPGNSVTSICRRIAEHVTAAVLIMYSHVATTGSCCNDSFDLQLCKIAPAAAAAATAATVLAVATWEIPCTALLCLV